MVPYDFIQTEGELEKLLAHLARAGTPRLAVDVEGENNLHSYGIHVALIQLFDGSRGYVVDALAVAHTGLLKALLEESSWVKVWFDAANDLLSFQHALGIRPGPLLDVAIAARLLQKPGGLQALTRQGGSASAKDRFQKSNWLRRPLSRAMLDYAISDVVHLLDLADELMAQIARRPHGGIPGAKPRTAERPARVGPAGELRPDPRVRLAARAAKTARQDPLVRPRVLWASA
jgi:ribonuclease D